MTRIFLINSPTRLVSLDLKPNLANLATPSLHSFQKGCTTTNEHNIIDKQDGFWQQQGQVYGSTQQESLEKYWRLFKQIIYPARFFRVFLIDLGPIITFSMLVARLVWWEHPEKSMPI